MKLLKFFTVFSVFSIGSIFSQQNTEHLSSARIQSNPEALQTFSNSEYVVLLGMTELKPGFQQFSVSWSNVMSGDGKSLPIKCVSNSKPNLFGFHFNNQNFSFFEEVYSSREKSLVIYLHTLNFAKQTIINKRVHAEEIDLKSKKNYFVHASHNKFSALYSFSLYNDGKQVPSVLIFDIEYNLIRNYTFKSTVDFNFDFQSIVQMNDEGKLLAVHKAVNEKEGNPLMFHVIDVQAESDSDNEFRPLYSVKGKPIHDFKVFLNDESIIEFVGLYNEKTEKGLFTKLAMRNFHPMKDRILLDTDFELKVPGNATFHSYLPISSEFFAVVTESKEQKSNAASSMSLSRVGQASAPAKIESHLLVSYFHLEKKLLWQEKLKVNFTEANPVFQKLNPKSLGYYFWSNGRSLFALYNAANDQSNTPNATVKGSGSQPNMVKPALTALTMHEFVLDNGSNKSYTLLLDEKNPSIMALPSLSKISNMKFMTTIAELNSETFYPVKLYLRQ